MKSISITIVAGLLVSACSTMQGTLAREPIFEGTTSKTLGQFQQCFIETVGRDDTLPAYLPTEHGGQYVLRLGIYQNYVAWVVSINDTGNQRQVAVQAKQALGYKFDKLVGQVKSCL